MVPIPGTATSLAIVGYPVSNETMAGRGSGDHAPDEGGSPEGPGASAGLLLDHDQRRVWADGQEISLTYQEFELLAFLSAHPATVFSRADLVAQVWQRDFAADSRTVDVHVSRLRHKLARGTAGTWSPSTGSATSSARSPGKRNSQPWTFGPAAATVMRSRTRWSRTIAAR